MVKTQLDTFTHAYVSTALWISTDESNESGGEPLDMNYGPEDIAPESLEQIIADCAKFQADNSEDIASDLDYAGHNFWLTRNGHGAGFWDGDWPEAIGERLTTASKAFGECSLYVGDDGKLYEFHG